MATKKAASRAKTTTRKSPAKKPTTTKVTTVKAVSAAPARRQNGRLFTFSHAPLIGAGIAELVGMFLFATGVLVVQGTSFYIGFVLAVVVLAIGTMSGAHVNPLLTVGAWVNRRIGGVRALVYLVAQVLGALLALVVMSAYVSTAPEVSQQAQLMGQSAATLFEAAKLPDGKEWIVLSAELLGSIIFAFVTASAWRMRAKLSSAFTIGFGFFLALAVAGLGAAGYVGAAAVLNPALAISLQAYSDSTVWAIAIYGLIPLVGGIAGIALNNLLNRESDSGLDA